MSRISILLIILLVTIGHASAADLRTELAKCRSIESLTLRLQCYDHLVDGAPLINGTANSASQIAPTSSATTHPAVVSQKPATSEELFGKSAEQVKQAVSIKLDIEPLDQISSKVTRVQKNSSQEYVVYLENGQVWKQKDKAGKWRIKVGETAIVSMASLGSYLMKSDARKKSVRAERLR
jgi:hypothetical protein